MTAIWMGILVLAAGAADAVAGVPQAAPAGRALADEVPARGWIVDTRVAGVSQRPAPRCVTESVCTRNL